MPHWLSVSTAAITTINRALFKAAVWIMAVVVPVMLYEVIARYLFNAPTTWGMELAVLLFGPYFCWEARTCCTSRGTLPWMWCASV